MGVNARGDVIGEISLLTGARRSATVRALEGATVYEIAKGQFEKVLRARPQLVEDLEAVMKKRAEDIRRHRQHHEAWPDGSSLSQRVRRFFFSGAGDERQSGVFRAGTGNDPGNA